MAENKKNGEILTRVELHGDKSIDTVQEANDSVTIQDDKERSSNQSVNIKKKHLIIGSLVLIMIIVGGAFILNNYNQNKYNDLSSEYTAQENRVEALESENQSLRDRLNEWTGLAPELRQRIQDVINEWRNQQETPVPPTPEEVPEPAETIEAEV